MRVDRKSCQRSTLFAIFSDYAYTNSEDNVRNNALYSGRRCSIRTGTTPAIVDQRSLIKIIGSHSLNRHFPN